MEYVDDPGLVVLPLPSPSCVNEHGRELNDLVLVVHRVPLLAGGLEVNHDEEVHVAVIGRAEEASLYQKVALVVLLKKGNINYIISYIFGGKLKFWNTKSTIYLRKQSQSR